jgi:hypothetical protein
VVTRQWGAPRLMEERELQVAGGFPGSIAERRGGLAGEMLLDNLLEEAQPAFEECRT